MTQKWSYWPKMGYFRCVTTKCNLALCKRKWEFHELKILMEICKIIKYTITNDPDHVKLNISGVMRLLWPKKPVFSPFSAFFTNREYPIFRPKTHHISTNIGNFSEKFVPGHRNCSPNQLFIDHFSKFPRFARLFWKYT